jgi:NAD(P)H dehydrogenase (quinone)
MSVTVFGATGKLGRHVLAALSERGVPPRDIVAAGRDLTKIDDMDVRKARVDYSDDQSERAALDGAHRVLLISSFDFGRRVDQNARVISAAREAGIELFAYTSSPKADVSTITMSREHAATEALLKESGVPFAILRNSIYMDIVVDQMAPEAVRDGAINAASGNGRLSLATRADLAAAAAEVLTGQGHAGAVYELGGDRSYTMPEVAAAIAEWSGKPVEYRNLPMEEFRALLVGRGLPESMAATFAETERGIAADEFYVETGDLSRLIGHPTTSFESALRAR